MVERNKGDGPLLLVRVEEEEEAEEEDEEEAEEDEEGEDEKEEVEGGMGKRWRKGLRSFLRFVGRIEDGACLVEEGEGREQRGRVTPSALLKHCFFLHLL
ncbi:unnamed protein product [Closterium sp. NIES-53]